MFLLRFFLFSLFSLLLFCLLKLVLFSKFNSFLPNLLSREHHKAICPLYCRNCQVLQKKTGNIIAVFCYSLQLKGCAHYSLLVDITHYWLFKFLVEVKFLVGTLISSRIPVNVNCREEIYPVLLKQYIIHKN